VRGVRRENRDFEIGFDWVCFFRVRGGEHFHNGLLELELYPFGEWENWFRFS